MRNDFVAFILSHGRAERVTTEAVSERMTGRAETADGFI